MKTENLSREQQQIETLWQSLYGLILVIEKGSSEDIAEVLPEIKEVFKNNKPTN